MHWTSWIPVFVAVVYCAGMIIIWCSRKEPRL